MSRRFLEALGDPRSVDELRARLARIGWHRYRIRPSDVEDVVQTAFATYLEVRHRYAETDDHHAILLGVFRKKCLEHIERSVRAARRLRQYCANPDGARENPWIRPSSPGEAPSVLDELIRRDARREILQAIASLRPSSRYLVGLITQQEMSRREMIRFLRLNKNTLDSRLHLTRLELRDVLRKLDRGELRGLPTREPALAAVSDAASAGATADPGPPGSAPAAVPGPSGRPGRPWRRDRDSNPR